MTHLQKLYRQLAPEFNLPAEEIERICRFQFAYVAEQMASGEYPQVRLSRLGAFTPNTYRLEKLREQIIKDNFQAFGHHAG